MSRFPLLLAGALLLAPAAAFAQGQPGRAPAPAAPAPATPAAPQSLGAFENWGAFTLTEGGKKTCYMVTRPTGSEPRDVNRGSIYITVTHRPADRVRGEVGVFVGYPLRERSSVEVTVGTAKFTLFTHADSAWVREQADERRLVEAMVRGSSLTVRGTSQRGTTTTDTYSLGGFSAALRAIDGACR